ncbi:MAG: SoxR reducing system RseC family protein [Deltaproteobacteria bacterium]|nr:MAG: SoxR reducing system RseC family protein [Deltaproteobacteria bacterium]
MITEEGMVRRTMGNKAWVITKRSEMCEACASHGACKTLGGGKEMEVEAINDVQARAGDQVLLTLQDQSLVKLSFLVYMFPILALIVGAALGQKAAPFVGVNSELSSFGLGAIFFGLAFLLVRKKDRKLERTGGTIPRVARIIKGE